MSLKKIQCPKRKANILLLLILPYDKSKISETIDILRELIQCLDLNDYFFENKLVIAKKDLLSIRNILWAIYQKQENPKIL